MLKFISFGSGSSGNCYYIFTENNGLLIDVGIGTRTLKKHFQAYGLSLNSVRQILITHDHADHIKSVGSISCKYKLPVFATEKVHNGIVNNYCVSRKLQSEHVKHISGEVPLQIGDFQIIPFLVPHDSSENVGYRIEYNNIVLCLMTDVGHITEEMKVHIAQANYLIIEANYDEEMLRSGSYPQKLKDRISNGKGHLSNNECGMALAQYATSNLKHVWLCHLSEENNHPELAKKSIEQTLRNHGIIAGVDFHLDVLKRKSPSGLFELT
ncbi:MAG: MBL fold metallo-hydrolase [Prevotella sp.]|nr:MBL fold metallo-hydrolase [Prevotella sp.]